MKGTNTKHRWLGAALGATLTLATLPAAAGEPRQVDWDSVIVGLDRFVRTGSAERPATPPKIDLVNAGKKIGPREAEPSKQSAPVTSDPNPQNLGNAWFGVAPRMTLVVRDWTSSMRLAGDRLSVVDSMRLAASTRMVVGRARLSGGTRFTPFLQVGLGQWRVDRNYLPFTPPGEEVATQLGTGFELRITRRVQLAAETTMTSLIRQGQWSAGMPPEAVLWSTYLASRIDF